MSRIILVSLTLVFANVCWVCDANGQGVNAKVTKAAAKDEPEKTFSFWMTKKLEYSQNILAGLARGDFDLIDENARLMSTLTKLEGFVRRRITGYRIQLQTFEFANQELGIQANRENIEGVALAFNQLTLSCVNCHKQLRGNGRTHAVGPRSERVNPK